MSQQVVPRFFLSTSTALGYLLMASCVQAQIIPDNTLPVNSTVTPGCTVCTIDGGTLRGANLFHSFSEFSVPTGGEANFNNGLQIQNIFTRVTGNSVSNIDGLLRTNGTASLFLLNPNGIIFGAGTSLNIGGSFLASTASSLVFANGTIFSATPATPTTPLLTIRVPIGLQYGSNLGNVQVQGATLQVNPGQTLALVGGNISLEGGQLLAPGGRVELAGVAGEGTVGLVANGSELSLSFPDSVPRGNVSLSDGALVNVTAGGGGSIGVNAFNLTMTQGSQLLAGIASDRGSVDAVAGNIEINTTGAIDLTDESYIFNDVRQGAKGQGGDVNITTSQLRLFGGAQVSASTSGQGDGGNLTVNATDKVQVIGTSADGQNPTSLRTESTGDAGNLMITTGVLQVQDGASVSVRSLTQQAGNLTIQANYLLLNRGSLIAETAKNSEDGTNINLVLDLLFLENENLISANAFNQANGGNIRIDSTFIILRGWSQITANAVEGNEGSIEITTSGIFLSGFVLFNRLFFGNLRNIQSGLINLQSTPLDTQVVSQTCQSGTRQNQNSFIITGRGGLPPNPRQVLRSRAVEVDWVTLDASANNPTEEVQNRGTQRQISRKQDAQTANNVNTRPQEIVEAQGWVIDDNGKIALVATAPTATPHSSWQKPADCHTEESPK